MCGIFGFATTQVSSLSYESLLKKLFLLSESRGKEAAGLAVRTDQGLTVIKQPHSASVLLKSSEYRSLVPTLRSAPFVQCIGHARLVTNGALEKYDNNQPVIRDTIVGVHNGIIVNDAQVWKQYPQLRRYYDVDTEVFLAVLQHALASGANISDAIRRVYSTIEGTASVAVLFTEYPLLVMSSNHGSLYYIVDQQRQLVVFASESYILRQALRTIGLDGMPSLQQLNAGALTAVGVDGTAITVATTGVTTPSPDPVPLVAVTSQMPALPRQRVSGNAVYSMKEYEQRYQTARAAIEAMQRCSTCILPETMPFIEFDSNGVCNYCRFYKPVQTHGRQALASQMANVDAKHPLLFAFSGGRDSSYGLHVLKKEMGIPVVAYSYDWGMITDLGRRNQSRMCSALNVEHILVSADIARKRQNIRNNVLAWLRAPDVGTVPLFMAGDKQYFYYAHKIAKQIQAHGIVMSENYYERTHFKHGFCGVTFSESESSPYMMHTIDRFKMLQYYIKAFLTNPLYLNSSLVDTFVNYLSYYFLPHEYIYFFKYIPWDEKTVDTVLISQYQWETAPDTETTWRIGDGTAPFYNYIYYLMAGFTENDTFRSNQIREGMITRAEAVRLSQRDNAPRFESMKWYFDTIGVDMKKALQVIHSQPTLY